MWCLRAIWCIDRALCVCWWWWKASTGRQGAAAGRPASGRVWWSSDLQPEWPIDPRASEVGTAQLPELGLQWLVVTTQPITAILLGNYDNWGRPVAVRDLLQDSIRLQLVKLGAHCILNGVADRPGLEELGHSIRFHQECGSLGGDSAWFVTEEALMLAQEGWHRRWDQGRVVNCSPIQPNAAEPIPSQETWSASGNHDEDQIKACSL